MGNKIYTSCIVPTRPLNVDKEDLTVIILAANIGYGMKSYGPKTLLTISNKETILEYQINIIKSVFPKADIILVVGFWADRIIRRCPSNVRIIENQLFETTNESEQLRLALNATLTNCILVIKDDIVFNKETLQDVCKDKSCLIYDSNNQIENDSVGVTIVNGFATIFSYDISTKWCHIAYLISKELKVIKNLCANRENSRLYFFELLNILLHKTEKIKAIEPKNMEIIKVDSSKNLDKLRG